MQVPRAPASWGGPAGLDGFGGSMVHSGPLMIAPQSQPGLDWLATNAPRGATTEVGAVPSIPVLPAPRTMQYKNYITKPPRFPEMPSEQVTCEGWGKASMQNIVDWMNKTFAEKYLQGEGDHRWYWMRIDGWIIEFWSAETWSLNLLDQRTILPMGWIDLRLVRDVEIQKSNSHFLVDCPHEVKVLLRSGYLSFFVRSAKEAFKWLQAIKAAYSEHMVAEDARRALAAEKAHDVEHRRVVEIGEVKKGPGEAKMVRGEDLVMHYVVDSRRKSHIRDVWVRCMRSAVGQTNATSQQYFVELFNLYDFDQNNDLSLDELEVMLKELIQVRWDEYHAAIKEQRDVVLSNTRLLLNAKEEERAWQKTVGQLSSQLKEIYMHLKKKEGFSKRAAIMRSELDYSRNGWVTGEEFVRMAPHLMLPWRELVLEAKFYGHCSAALKKATRQERALRRLEESAQDSDSSDEGCVQS